MLRRLVFGFVLGLLIGVLAAAGLVLGPLKMTVFDGVALAYIAASVVGVLTGLVTGKPVWATNAKIEATLKAVFGGLLGAGALFALHRWAASVTLDLGAYGPGEAKELWALPAASLPLIAATLGALFGLDNTDAPAEAKPAVRKRVGSQRVDGALPPAESEEEEVASPDARAVSKRAKP